MSGVEILLTIVLGLAVAEFSDVSPWAGRRLVRVSTVLRYTEPERRQIRTDELVALIDERPGKLFKLFTALGFLFFALLIWARRVVAFRLRRLTRRSATDLSPVGFSAGTVATGSDPAELPRLARQVNAAIRALDATAGAVVTVRGPWGSGKTSVVQAALADLHQVQVVEFNPWLAWNEQGSAHVLTGLPDRLRSKSQRLGNVAATLDRCLDHLASRPVRGRLRRFTNSVTSRRQLRRALRMLPQPLMVVLDDIDRMPPEKVHETLDFVEHTANLPQLIHVMSFDASQIEPIVTTDSARTWRIRRPRQQIAFDLTCTHRSRPTTLGRA